MDNKPARPIFPARRRTLCQAGKSGGFPRVAEIRKLHLHSPHNLRKFACYKRKEQYGKSYRIG